MTAPVSFRDERFEKKGDNLFQASVILSFRDGKDNKTLVGKSTMPVKRPSWRKAPQSLSGGVQTNIEITEFMEDGWYSYEKRKMKEEARQAALLAFFKEVYGFTDTSNIAVDEFDRPRNDKTRQPCSDCLTIDLTTET